MPAALAALVVYDPEADAATNQRRDDRRHRSRWQPARSRGPCATPPAPAGAIVTGDWIGLVRGDGIVAVSGSLEGAATALLDHLVTATSEIVTVITGADATPVQTAALVAWLADERPTAEVEVHHGGQPLYPYLFGVE